MANTTLQIRHSTVQGNTPPSLANGEIAINSRDGILFYATPSGVVTTFSTGPSGLDTEIQFNDAGSVGASEKLTFNKTTGQLTVSGNVRANLFSDDGIDIYDFSNRAFTTANAAFDAANNATDTYVRNHANAAFAAANGAVAVNLTQNNSITVALNTANAAFAQANNAATVTPVVFEITSNGTVSTYDIGFNPITKEAVMVTIAGIVQPVSSYSVDASANTITFSENPQNDELVRVASFYSNASVTYFESLTNITQNNSITAAFFHANSAYQSQNASGNVANSGFSHANAAFNAANNALDTWVRGQANAAFIQANASFNTGNSAFIHANAAFNAANNALDTWVRGQANAAFIQANAVFTQSNNYVWPTANAAFIRANNSLDANNGGTVSGDVRITGNLTVTGNTTYVNTSQVLIGDNIITLNAAINQASAPMVDAGIEVDRGNAANVYMLWNETEDRWTFTNDGVGYDGVGYSSTAPYANAAFTVANGAFFHANAGFSAQNTTASYANSAFIQANASFTVANGAFIHANASFNHANAAYLSQNATGNYANSAFLTANSAGVYANAAFTAANSAGVYANGAFGVANSASVYANGAFIVANAASIRSLNFIIDGGGSVITAGSKGNVMIDFAGTIDGWAILGDASGSITVDVSKSTYATFPTFTASSGTSPALSSQQKNQRIGINWTGFTTVSANDIIRFAVSGTPATVTTVTVALRITSTS